MAVAVGIGEAEAVAIGDVGGIAIGRHVFKGEGRWLERGGGPWSKTPWNGGYFGGGFFWGGLGEEKLALEERGGGTVPIRGSLVASSVGGIAIIEGLHG